MDMELSAIHFRGRQIAVKCGRTALLYRTGQQWVRASNIEMYGKILPYATFAQLSLEPTTGDSLTNTKKPPTYIEIEVHVRFIPWSAH